MNIEKSGGVAEGHNVGFLLYSGERPKGARRNIAHNDVKYFIYSIIFDD